MKVEFDDDETALMKNLGYDVEQVKGAILMFIKTYMATAGKKGN